MGKSKASNVFAVHREVWPEVCQLGMNAAALYLVMAAGTQGNNQTTSWSANALEKYAGVSRSNAKRAKELVCESRFVTVLNGGNHPRYKLEWPDQERKDADLIWLPNQIVVGVGGEATPLARVRQTGDPLMLRLFVELYYYQNLVEHWGIPRDIVSRRYIKKTLAEIGQFDVLAFDWETTTSYPHHPVNCPIYNRADTDEQGKDDYFRAIHTLTSLGLLEWVPMLCECGDDPHAEIVYPLVEVFDSYEIPDAITSWLDKNLPDIRLHQSEEHEFVAPIYRHYQKATVVGIARTRYRANTSLTSAARARLAQYEQQVAAMLNPV